MKKIINGKNYRFIINCLNSSKNSLFYIEAQHKKNRTHSFINNVNCILSGLDIDDINDNKMSESQWVVTKKEATKFVKQAHNILADNYFREYIERYLDLDRSLGEWNKL